MPPFLYFESVKIMNLRYNMFDLLTASFIHTKKILSNENKKKVWLYFVYTLILSGLLFGIDPDANRVTKIYIDIMKDMLMRYGLVNENFSFNLFTCEGFKFLNLDFLNSDIFKVITDIVNNQQLVKYLTTSGIYLGIFILISVVLIFFCIFRGKLMLMYSVSTNRDDSYNWKDLWKKFALFGNYSSIIFSTIFCVCIFIGWLIGHALLFPMCSKLIGNLKGVIYLDYIPKEAISTVLYVSSFLVSCIAILFFFYLFFLMYIYFVFPILVKFENKIKWFEDFKNIWISLKTNFWTKILNMICACFIIFVTSSFFKMLFLGIQNLFNLLYSCSDLFISSPYTALIVYSLFYLLIYLPIILFLNVPVGVFYTSLQVMIFSYIFPEYALLKPSLNDKGKVIGTECLL